MTLNHNNNNNVVLFISDLDGETYFAENVNFELYSILQKLPFKIPFDTFEHVCTFMRWITGCNLERDTTYSAADIQGMKDWAAREHGVQNIDLLRNAIPMMFDMTRAKELNLKCNEPNACLLLKLLVQ